MEIAKKERKKQVVIQLLDSWNYIIHSIGTSRIAACRIKKSSQFKIEFGFNA